MVRAAALAAMLALAGCSEMPSRFTQEKDTRLTNALAIGQAASVQASELRGDVTVLLAKVEALEEQSASLRDELSSLQETERLNLAADVEDRENLDSLRHTFNSNVEKMNSR